MEKHQVDELIAKYNEGLADPSELKWIEQLIESGEVHLTQLHELSTLDKRLTELEVPPPSLRLDDQFHTFLAGEKRKQRISRLSFSLPDWNVLFPRLAFAMVVAVAGFTAGYLVHGPSQNPEVRQLTQEVSDLKEMWMISLLEKESATDRLKAVNLTSEMPSVSQKVTNALFKALNNDENVNVRLAALDALTPYANQSLVRERLIKSISLQESPLVQVALAELMVAAVEKKSVAELQKIIDNQRTPDDVKNKIKESIRVLI